MPKHSLAEWRLAAGIAWDDAWFRWQTIATVALGVMMSVYLLVHLVPIGIRNGLLVFHYSIYFGIDDIRAWPWIFVLPLGTLAVIGTDLVASIRLYRHDRIASRVLLGAATLFAAIASVYAVYLAIVNG